MTSFGAAMARRESRVVRIVRRAALAIACLYAVSFTWSIYRRLWQVLRIEVRAASPVLVPGTVVGYDVVTSGEVPNLIRLELVQGAHAEVLLEQRASVNRIRTLDPRVFRSTPAVTLDAALLERFHSGPATLRVTGFGGQKLLRIPPPRMRELEVRVRR